MEATEHILFIDSNRSGFGRTVIEYAQNYAATTFATFHPEYFIDSGERPCDSFLALFDNILIHDTHNDVPGLIGRLDVIHGRHPFTAVIATSDAEAITAARVAEHFGLPTPGVRAIQACVDKSQTRQVLAEHTVHQPGWAWVEAPVESLQGIDSQHRLTYPLVAKATDASDSMFVTLVGDDAELHAASCAYFSVGSYSRDVQPSERFLLEEYLEGPLYSVEGYCRDGQVHPLGVTTRELSAPPHFVELGAGHPWQGDEAQVLVDEAKAALRALEYDTGFFHVELILHQRIPKVVEVNPRLAGLCITQGMAHVYGQSFEKLLISLMSGHSLPELQPQKYMYVAMSRATPGGRVDSDIGSCAGLDGVVLTQQKRPVGSRVDQLTGSNRDIVALVVAVGQSYDQACGNAHAAIEDYERAVVPQC